MQYAQLFFIELLLQAGAYIGKPIVSSFAVELGAAVALAGFIAGLNSSLALLMRPTSGIIADVLSKKRLLVIAAALFAVSAFGCMMAKSALIVGIFYALQGFAFAFKSTTVVSLASLVVPKTSIGMAVGWLGLTNTLASATSPVVASWIEKNLGFSACFALAGLLFLAATTIAMRFREPESSKRTTKISSLNPSQLFDVKGMFYRPAILYSVVGGFVSVAHGTMVSHMVLMESMGAVEHASIYFVIYSLMALAARPLAGWASDRFGGAKIIPPMLIVAAMGTATLSISGSFASVFIAGFCMGVGQASVFSAVQAEAVRGAPDHEVGRAANTFFIGSDVAMGFSPFLGGLVLQVFGPSATFAYCSVSTCLALAVFLGVRAVTKNAAAVKEQAV